MASTFTGDTGKYPRVEKQSEDLQLPEFGGLGLKLILERAMSVWTWKAVLLGPSMLKKNSMNSEPLKSKPSLNHQLQRHAVIYNACCRTPSNQVELLTLIFERLVHRTKTEKEETKRKIPLGT